MAPVYPDEAKQARIQGVVRFNVLLDGTGNVKNLGVVGGHPLLVGPPPKLSNSGGTSQRS